MEKIEIDEIKKIQLKILNDVHDFCVKNGIRYFLYYGTLLGAVRHKGYIPWDDDIDIAMPRADYEKFIKEYRSTRNYKVISFENNNEFLFAYAKVHDDSTIFIENSNLKAKFGINIDVFPIDNIVCDNQIKKLNFLKKIIDIKIIKFSNKRSFIKNVILFIFKIFTCFLSPKYIIKKMIAVSKLGINSNTSFVDAISAGFSSTRKISVKFFLQFVETEFEKRKYIIPADYDRILKCIYGDYSVLPPVEKQIAHHDYQAFYKNERSLKE